MYNLEVVIPPGVTSQLGSLFSQTPLVLFFPLLSQLLLLRNLCIERLTMKDIGAGNQFQRIWVGGKDSPGVDRIDHNIERYNTMHESSEHLNADATADTMRRQYHRSVSCPLAHSLTPKDSTTLLTLKIVGGVVQTTQEGFGVFNKLMFSQGLAAEYTISFECEGVKVFSLVSMTSDGTSRK